MRTKRYIKNMSNTTKTQRLYELIATGTNVPAKTLAKKLKVASVASLVTALRKDGAVIHKNETAQGTAYRFDTLRSYAA
jgi:hypothetical protein